MIIKRIISSVLLLSATSMTYAMNPGLYVGTDLGKTNTHNVAKNVQTDSGTIRVTPSNTGYGGRIYLGYQLSPYAAFEGGYTFYGTSAYKSPAIPCDSPGVREKAYDFVGKGIMPFSNFSLFAKAGLASIKATESRNLDPETLSACGGASHSYSNVRPTIGLGVSYELSSNWVTDLTWSRVMKGSQIYNADLIAVGLTYHLVDQYCGQFIC